MKQWAKTLNRKVRDAVEAAVSGVTSDPPSGPGSSGPPSHEVVAPPSAGASEPLAEGQEPPVVARLIVEIRSDGTQTIARGAMEDVATGHRTTVQASGGTPAQLAASLAGSLLTAPIKLGDIAGAVLRKKLGRALSKKD